MRYMQKMHTIMSVCCISLLNEQGLADSLTNNAQKSIKSPIRTYKHKQKNAHCLSYITYRYVH